MTVNMDWLRQKVRSREAKPVWYDGLGDMERLEEYRAYSALLGFLEGYDPAERLPEDGQWVCVQVATVGGGAIYEAAWIADLSQFWDGRDKDAPRYWDLDEVVRWYPMPGGER